MAYFSFTDKLRAGEKLKSLILATVSTIFTYLDDIVEGMLRVMKTTALEKDAGVKPRTSLREGLRKSAQWYKDFYLKEK